MDGDGRGRRRGSACGRCAPRGCYSSACVFTAVGSVSCVLFGCLKSQAPGRRVFGVLWFSAVCVGMHCLHSLFTPSVFSSSTNVRVSTDAPSGSPWVSHQSELGHPEGCLALSLLLHPQSPALALSCGIHLPHSCQDEPLSLNY